MAITIKRAIGDELENLSKGNFKKFCDELLDRREEPRVLRRAVEDKDPGDIAQFLVSTFTEPKALQVAMDTLRGINCNEAAHSLESRTRFKVSVDKQRKKKRNPPFPGLDRPRPPSKRQRSLAEASQSGREYPESKTRKRPKVSVDNGDPALPKTSSGELKTEPSQEAREIVADQKQAKATGQGGLPPKKPEDVEDDAEARVRSEGGDPSNERLVLSRFIIQFGQYKGQTFKWLLENDVGYAVFVVATHRKERKSNKDQSPLMIHKDSLTRYAKAYRDVMKKVSLYRFAGQPSTASRLIRGKQKRSRKK